ncbi:MAG: hydantoinase B/oxoprolinase family protein [Minwuia sp.]|uniref:hydantoinase B/oxoprolinase family protein n=1 Tax=Minwuia sp. TaxID=2493630 RepID=UPI003A835CF2
MIDPAKTDFVTMNIIESSMISICREMGITLMKTSYSTIFNEALDFTCAIASPQGEMWAVAEFCPAQIGGMPLIIRSSLEEIPLESIEPGDVLVHNDPYRGGLHTPEHTLFCPVFVDDQLVAFTVAIGHVAEVGGMVPGGFASEATEIFHEGIRVPPVKIKKRGEDVEEVWKLWLANVRTPRYNYGDMRALISGVEVGSARMAETVKKYGTNAFNSICADLMDYSEARMRAEIQEIPDGRYVFDDFMDNDGVTEEEIRIHVECHVQDDEIVVDFDGSSPQVPGPINATLGVTWSAAYNAVLHLTDPSIPKNSGCFRPIRVLAPAGTIVNVDYPAPEVGGNTETHPRIAGTVIGALARAKPDRAMACEGGTHLNFVFGGEDKKNGEYFACYDIELVGWGATPSGDGNDATDAINGNCRVIPVEVFETRYPWLTEQFSLVPDSGGAGRTRGGLGTQKTLRCLDAEITASQLSDRHVNRAYGLNGGGEGQPGATLFRKAGTDDWKPMTEAFGKASSSKWSNIKIRPGDSVRFVMAGGGGMGPVTERDPQSVQEDILEGYITPETAKAVYGYTAEGDD